MGEHLLCKQGVRGSSPLTSTSLLSHSLGCMACFSVYVLQSEATGRYYIGSTADLGQRLLRHNAGRMQATKHSRPWRLVYSEPFDTLAEARHREMQIKSWKNPEYMRRTLGLTE